MCQHEIMVTRNVSKDNAELAALLEEMERGGDVVLVEAGRPVAVLVPFGRVYPFADAINRKLDDAVNRLESIPARPARKPGSMAGQIWVAPDFDVLPDDIAEAFGVHEPPR